MITDIERKWLQDILDGKIKPKQNPRKTSAYYSRINKRIDHMIKNGLWLAEHRPDLIQDLKNELADENLPMKRRARALLKMVTLFENEPTVLSLIAEIYSEQGHSIEVSKK